MRFHSLQFLIFAAVFFAVWQRVREPDRPRWLAIAGFSFFFYGWWDFRYVGLLLLSGLVDYVAAARIRSEPDTARWMLVLSIACNLAILGAFKYAGFLGGAWNQLAGALGLPGIAPVLSVLPPAGLSFYTFQSMSYTIDVYRGRVEPARNLLHFFSYLALFPQLVAGPIVRARDLLPQLLSGKAATESQRWAGLVLIARGYFKKLVLADNLAPAVERAFSSLQMVPSAPYWWLVITMTAFQVYGDFSGYTDIARGLCRWMGYDIPINFDRPYTATDMRDFWRRWHISLTTWFRDYVYHPLGGDREGPIAAIRNVWITMLLVGIWHGASWSFVCFGAVHALFLTIERLWKLPAMLGALPGGRVLRTVLVLVQVWIGYVFFRAVSLEQAQTILAVMFDPTALGLEPLAMLLPAVPFLALGIAGELAAALLPWEAIERRRSWRLVEPVVVAVMIFCCVYFRGPGESFVYFQF